MVSAGNNNDTPEQLDTYRAVQLLCRGQHSFVSVGVRIPACIDHRIRRRVEPSEDIGIHLDQDPDTRMRDIGWRKPKRNTNTKSHVSACFVGGNRIGVEAGEG